MRRNVGGVDRLVRFVLGLAGIAAGIYFKSWWGLAGVVVLATAAFGVCGAYYPLGISTCAPKAGKQA